jgi:hypothetical protein
VSGPLAQILAFASTGLLAVLAVTLSRRTLAYHGPQPLNEAEPDVLDSSPSTGAGLSR